MLLKLSSVRGFYWMEIPRLDLYSPAVFRLVLEKMTILKLTFKSEHGFREYKEHFLQ